jgi:hypothetical protein
MMCVAGDVYCAGAAAATVSKDTTRATGTKPVQPEYVRAGHWDTRGDSTVTSSEICLGCHVIVVRSADCTKYSAVPAKKRTTA